MIERSLELSSQELLQANSEVRAIFEAFPDLFLRLNADGVILSYKTGSDMSFILPASELLGKRIQEIPCNPVTNNFTDAVRQVRETRSIVNVEFSTTAPLQEMFFEARLLPILRDQIFVVVRDITQRRRAEEALAEQAIRDPLTNLYNRRYFNHRMKEELARAARQEGTFALLVCDLDKFKTINDTLGHHVGDEVLKAVAESIRNATRGIDLVVRWGGDEIIVLLADDDRAGALTAANRIRANVLTVGETAHVDLDICIGVAMYPEHGHSTGELVRLADRALYIAKKSGGKIHIGEEEYQLNSQAIKVVFQPVVDVRSGRVTMGYEALGRDPQGKVGILELFKRYQAIGQLTELKRLCFQSQLLAAWEVGLDRVFINVNFDVIGQLDCPVKPSGMDVILEISELDALHDVGKYLEITRRWRAHGYQFAIDDFGAGFISLPFIAEAVPEYIKVDRSTILQAVRSERFRTFFKDLVKALQGYAKKGIIAEGVETDHELEVVQEVGINLIQGYLLGRPQELPLQARRAA
jgi:diguanylate cyclase (GGDEF)-like protein